MVRGDVKQYGYISTEIVHIVELERTQLDDIVFVWILCHLECQRITDVTSQTSIVSCLLKDVVDKRGCGSFTIRTCDANHLRVCITTSKLNLADDMDAFCDDFLNHRSGIGNTRTLDNLICIQNLLFCVLTFFPLNLVVIQLFLVLVGNLRHLKQTHQSLPSLREQQLLRHFLLLLKLQSVSYFYYRIFNVMSVRAARIIEVIQNRMVIFDSWKGR